MRRDIVHNLFHLNQNLSAKRVTGLRHCKRVHDSSFLFHADVSVAVCPCATQECEIHFFDRLIADIVLSVNIDDLIELVCGAAVEPSAGKAGIHKGIKADMRNKPRTFCRRIPQKLCDHALGKVIRLDVLGKNHLL